MLRPDELQADTAYYRQNVEGLSSQVRESEAALRFQQRQLTDQIAQAESTLAQWLYEYASFAMFVAEPFLRQTLSDAPPVSKRGEALTQPTQLKKIAELIAPLAPSH